MFNGATATPLDELPLVTARPSTDPAERVA